MPTPVMVRPLRASDVNFIRSSWFESLWKNGARHDEVPYDVFSKGQAALILRLLESSTVRIVHPTGLEEHICGYSVVEGEALHWVYVRSAYRRLGIASGLVPEGTKYYTHRAGGTGKQFVKKLNLLFNPYHLLSTHGNQEPREERHVR